MFKHFCEPMCIYVFDSTWRLRELTDIQRSTAVLNSNDSIWKLVEMSRMDGHA